MIWTDAEGLNPELTASVFPPDRSVPLSPPAVSGDRVVVAENWNDGYTEEGGVYMLLRTPEFEASDGRGSASYQLVLVNSWPFSAVAAPLFVGSSLWVGGTGANLAGWTGNRDVSGDPSDIDPRWTLQLETNALNESQRKFCRTCGS